jgi:hypothetical protein
VTLYQSEVVPFTAAIGVEGGVIIYAGGVLQRYLRQAWAEARLQFIASGWTIEETKYGR